MIPKLLKLTSVEEYKKYYEENFCIKPTITYDGIPVYFKKDRFEHAFYESSDKNGSKDLFSHIRAERMSWIKYLLVSSNAVLLQGWNKKKRKYDPCVRVAYEFECFVVIVRISLRQDGKLKGNFITCYQAENSIEKIKKSPSWNKNECLKLLNGR